MPNLISPETFISLKEKVKSECLRREYENSVAEYGSTAYDFNIIPSDKNLILKEHYQKIIIPLNKINTSDNPYDDTIKHKVVIENELIKSEANVTLYAASPPVNQTSTDCSVSCAGLCYLTCSSDCTGGCNTGCTGCRGCRGCTGCTGCTGCGDDCGTSCSGCRGCGVACSDDCDSCTDNCSHDCGGNGCYEACNSCSNGCQGGCTSGCYGGASDNIDDG